VLVPEAAEVSSEEEFAAAFAAAIDKARQIRFNPDHLRLRAETFSAARFRERIQSLLSASEERVRLP
jgi:hypothetical protein